MIIVGLSIELKWTNLCELEMTNRRVTAYPTSARFCKVEKRLKLQSRKLYHKPNSTYGKTRLKTMELQIIAGRNLSRRGDSPVWDRGKRSIVKTYINTLLSPLNCLLEKNCKGIWERKLRDKRMLWLKTR